MIVKNEESSLPQALNSAKDVVDEMVILDTGSTDKTVEIAKAYGARVYQFEWCNDFSAARNQALQYVQGKWVLVLDADEVLTQPIVPELKQVIHNEQYLLINLIRQEVGAAQSPYSQVSRLFRNHPEVYFSRPYHAIVDDSVVQLLEQEPQWRVASLPKVAILHYGYQPEAIASRDKYNRGVQAMEAFLAEHPDDPYGCSKLGAFYIGLGQLGKGIELLERGLRAQQIDAPVLFELHYHLGNAYTRLKNPPSAAEHYQEAIKQQILPQLKIGAYNNLGNLHFSAGDLTQARTNYETTVKIDPSFAAGYNNLGMTFKGMGLLEEAIRLYQQAIKCQPDYADAHQNLGVAFLKKGKVQQSLSAFGKAIALHETHNPTEAKRLRQGLQDMGFPVN
ncbi:MAG: tetratricopeptide repeat protein [Symploca sp. SIO2G7]|nr:tetratricopeptide repeat protein [Symploca sp. SIO2G7]